MFFQTLSPFLLIPKVVYHLRLHVPVKYVDNIPLSVVNNIHLAEVCY